MMRALPLRLSSNCLLLVAFLTLFSNGQEDPLRRCRSASGSLSCGQCIKQDPQCAWCMDPDFKDSSQRCDAVSNLEKTCPEGKIYHPKAELEKIRDLQVGTQQPNSPGTVQLQPQHVNIKMKPNEMVRFQLSYLHLSNSPATASVMNSETESHGLSIHYSVMCKGRRIESNKCRDVTPSATVVFDVSLTLKRCRSAGDIVVSIGVGGVREVVALFVTPVCGCECEKLPNQIQRADMCNSAGSLVCGSCVCEKGRGGPSCECDLAQTNAKNAEELMAKCVKPNPYSKQYLICSGQGTCQCGKCNCNGHMTGRFCDCDDHSCPLSGGRMCAGRGECHCGVCDCQQGWTGTTCECPTDTSACNSKDGLLCSGRGECICGKCRCSGGLFSGKVCERHDDYDMDFPKNQPSSDPDPDPAFNDASGQMEKVETKETKEKSGSLEKAPNKTSAANVSVLRFSTLLSVFLAPVVYCYLLIIP